MKREPIACRAMRLAERGARDDAGRLVASVPDIVCEARRRRAASANARPGFDQLAFWALPRLAAVTAVAVLVATSFALWERSAAAPAATAFDSVVMGDNGDVSDDAVLDTLLDPEGSDG